MKFSVPGKCILAGEHAVVRGHKALVTPLASYSLELEFEPGDDLILPLGPFREPLIAALNRAMDLVGRKISGTISVNSSIPPGAGLGSSAALSVAVARLFEAEVFSLALELENLFHGKSSGIDLAAVCSEQPILFQKEKKAVPVAPLWKPGLYLFDTGIRSSTKACVEKVAAMGRTDLDTRMEGAALLFLDCLRDKGAVAGVAEAMEEARKVFQEWGLIPKMVEAQILELRSLGAQAVKPTGSGDGGFLLCLWKEPPPGNVHLIPVWS